MHCVSKKLSIYFLFLLTVTVMQASLLKGDLGATPSSRLARAPSARDAESQAKLRPVA